MKLILQSFTFETYTHLDADIDMWFKIDVNAIAAALLLQT
jgi:hypothetical protein